MLDLVYKSVDGLDISISVKIPNGASAENPAPALLWFHGGE
jgi:dipeptidyl aminopeptidase/acylaminoacyl peptidase